MQNENDSLEKIETEATTADEEKLRSETTEQNNSNSKKQVRLLSTKEILSLEQVVI